MDPVPNPIGRPGLPADQFFKQGVVHAHKDRNDIGMQIQHILLPAVGQIGQFVAAETAVVELIARTRMPRFVPRGHERHVRVPINMVQVCLAPIKTTRDPSSPFLFREKASGQLAQHATKSPHNTNLILRIITPQHGLD